MTSYQYQPGAPIPAKDLKDLDFIFPNGPSRCTWKVGSNQNSPHNFQAHHGTPQIIPNVLHTVGNTPMIKLNRIPESLGIECEVLAKCEFFNPCGSVKDRIALRMVQDAEDRGILKPGDTIIEPTSGNTGLGLAMAAAVKGYRCIIVMPIKMSNEKVDALKALGAEIIRTPTSASFDSPESLISVAQKLCKEIPNSIILDQYRNAYNPIAHYEHTAQEIIEACGGKIDVLVCAAGTGGTITGLGRKLKEVCPSCKIIGVDPLGSILSQPEELNITDVTFYEVEGIGYDFIPTVLDRSVVDKWVKSNDKDSLIMARRLIREEGLLCGGSSGANLSAALEIAKTMSAGQRMVVLLPDGMRNYMSKFIDDSWMDIRNFTEKNRRELWWFDKPVSSLELRAPSLIKAEATCDEVTRLMRDENRDFVFVEKEGDVIGVVTASKLLTQVADSKLDINQNIQSFVDPVRKVQSNTPLKRVSVILEKERFVIVDNTHGEANGDVISWKWKFATSPDLLHFINNSKSKASR